MSRLYTIRLTLLIVEFAVCATAVALFGLAYPDRFRTRLWENGGEAGFNSNPKLRIYLYANHQPVPEIPWIWSQQLTDSNLAISLLSLVICMVRIIMLRTGYLPRYASVLYDMLLSTLWVFSLAGQNSGDHSDPTHVSPHPWYISRGCSASWKGNRAYCHLVRASFALSMFAAVLYGSRLLLEAVVMATNRSEVKGEYKRISSAEENWYGSNQEKGDVKRVVYIENQALSPVLAFFPPSSTWYEDKA